MEDNIPSFGRIGIQFFAFLHHLSQYIPIYLVLLLRLQVLIEIYDALYAYENFYWFRDACFGGFDQSERDLVVLTLNVFDDLLVYFGGIDYFGHDVFGSCELDGIFSLPL